MTLSKHTALLCSIHALLALLLVAGCSDDDSSGGDDHDGGDHGDHAGSGGGGDEAGSGGGGAEDASAPSGIEVAGSWTSEFGDETIDDTMWNGASIVRFDNEENATVTQDAPSTDDAGAPVDGAFNKIVWTEIEGDAFYYCWVAFGQATADEADENAMPADDADPETGGCGDADFPWTKLERK